MRKKDMISVIMPIYNGERFLEEAISSVLAQTYRNIELLLIDDGSTDASGAICDRFAGEDGRVRVIHKQNAGVSAARNTGMGEAEGEYIGFVDCDDLCEKDMLEKLHAEMTKTEADLAMGMFSDLIQDEKKYRIEPLMPGIYTDGEIKESILLPMVGSPAAAPQCAPVMGMLCRCLFQAELIEAGTPVRMQKITMAEDLLFILEYLCRCRRVTVIEDSVYNYRQNDQSALHSYIKNLYGNITLQLSLMRDVLVKNNLFDGKMKEYYESTVAYDLAWCMTNECKKTNPATAAEIVKNMKRMQKAPEFRGVPGWKFVRQIRTKEKYYFLMIQLHMYRAILFYNRRKS